MRDIKLIALDLDGTLLNSRKELTPRCRAALEDANRAGAEIVPATGRFFRAIPEAVRSLPFLGYAITINGAEVFDLRRNASIYAAEIPLERALAVMTFLDGWPVLYDCYLDNWGYITVGLWERAEEFVPDPFFLKMMQELRRPVPELKAFLSERKSGAQKIQLYTRDLELRAHLLRALPEQFPDLAVTTSVPNNIEINAARANKGDALLALAEYLHVRPEQTAAFGDGTNDLPMLRAAGVGVAMGNACPEALAAADEVTAGCDGDGVALWLELALQKKDFVIF